jgi:hypothetical protein
MFYEWRGHRLLFSLREEVIGFPNFLREEAVEFQVLLRKETVELLRFVGRSHRLSIFLIRDAVEFLFFFFPERRSRRPFTFLRTGAVDILFPLSRRISLRLYVLRG